MVVQTLLWWTIRCKLKRLLAKRMASWSYILYLKFNNLWFLDFAESEIFDSYAEYLNSYFLNYELRLELRDDFIKIDYKCYSLINCVQITLSWFWNLDYWFWIGELSHMILKGVFPIYNKFGNLWVFQNLWFKMMNKG